MASFTISESPPPKKSAHTTSPFTTPGRRRKYYVVSAGKCTGVFDSWLYSTSYILISTIYLFQLLNRPYVQSITSGVSGNCQKSYTTYDEAWEVYQDLKASGLVRIIRNRGDEDLFGPVEDAIK